MSFAQWLYLNPEKYDLLVQNLVILGILVLAVIILLIMMIVCSYTTKQKTVDIVQRNGKFRTVSYAGKHLRLPCDKVIATVDLRKHIENVDTFIVTKDKFKVFISISFSWRLTSDNPKDIYTFFYTLHPADDRNLIRQAVIAQAKQSFSNTPLDSIPCYVDQLTHNIKTVAGAYLGKYSVELGNLTITDVGISFNDLSMMREVARTLQKVPPARRKHAAF